MTESPESPYGPPDPDAPPPATPGRHAAARPVTEPENHPSAARAGAHAGPAAAEPPSPYGPSAGAPTGTSQFEPYLDPRAVAHQIATAYVHETFPHADKRTMARWALTLSLFGFCGISLPIAAGLAILVLARSRDGVDRGKGLAIAALALAGVWVVALVTLGLVGAQRG